MSHLNDPLYRSNLQDVIAEARRSIRAEPDFTFIRDCIIEQLALALDDTTSPNAPARHREICRALHDPTYQPKDLSALLAAEQLRRWVDSTVDSLRSWLKLPEGEQGR